MRKMLSKIINTTAEDCGKTKLNKLKKISTLLNNINLPRSLLSNNLKRLNIINIFKEEKISLSLLNFRFKEYLLKRKMPNIKNTVIIPSYGYHKKINDFIQDLKLNNNIVKCLHLTYNYNLLEIM